LIAKTSTGNHLTTPLLKNWRHPKSNTELETRTCLP
jgi:hypothetical protein